MRIFRGTVAVGIVILESLKSEYNLEGFGVSDSSICSKIRGCADL